MKANSSAHGTQKAGDVASNAALADPFLHDPMETNEDAVGPLHNASAVRPPNPAELADPRLPGSSYFAITRGSLVGIVTDISCIDLRDQVDFSCRQFSSWYEAVGFYTIKYHELGAVRLTPAHAQPVQLPQPARTQPVQSPQPASPHGSDYVSSTFPTPVSGSVINPIRLDSPQFGPIPATGATAITPTPVSRHRSAGKGKAIPQGLKSGRSSKSKTSAPSKKYKITFHDSDDEIKGLPSYPKVPTHLQPTSDLAHGPPSANVPSATVFPASSPGFLPTRLSSSLGSVNSRGLVPASAHFRPSMTGHTSQTRTADFRTPPAPATGASSAVYLLARTPAQAFVQTTAREPENLAAIPGLDAGNVTELPPTAPSTPRNNRIFTPLFSDGVDEGRNWARYLREASDARFALTPAGRSAAQTAGGSLSPIAGPSTARTPSAANAVATGSRLSIPEPFDGRADELNNARNNDREEEYGIEEIDPEHLDQIAMMLDSVRYDPPSM